MIVVTRQERLRFCAQLGSHELILDQPLNGGGDDAGPTPLDLLGAGIGGCVALYVHKFLDTRGVADDGLRVEVIQHTARNPHRIERFEVRIVVPPDMPDVYKPMIESIARVCPVYNTLARGSEVTVTVDAPVLEQSAALR
jgi:putative redox protein